VKGAIVFIIEGTLWPLVMVGAIDDATVPPRDACIVNEEWLAMSGSLAVGVVVAGTGEQATRAQHAALDWLERHQRMLVPRVLRLAWVIEDERIRACTDAWLRCMGQTLFTIRSETFRTVQAALSWLLNTPWPTSGTSTGDERMGVTARSSPPLAHYVTAQLSLVT
jgi:hypothetical protein